MSDLSITPISTAAVNAALDTAYTTDTTVAVTLLFGGSVNLGTGGTIELKYKRVGRTVDFYIAVAVGASPTVGSGPWIIAASEFPYLPIESANSQPGKFGAVYTASQGFLETAIPIFFYAGSFPLTFGWFCPPGDGNVGNLMGNGNPIPIVEGTNIEGAGNYEAKTAL